MDPAALRSGGVSEQAYGWEWHAFQGSREALNWARHDVPALDSVVARTKTQTAVIQAGGNLGIFPKRLAQTFQTVYTFEPAPALFPMMLANAPESNIVRFQAALGETRAGVQMAQVRRHKLHMPPHEGITHVAGAGVIPTLRIDDLALPVCELIYLDLEGYELFALRGAVETLARCRPVVGVEVNKNITHYGLTADDLRAFMSSEGYVSVDRQRSDEVFMPRESVS